MQNESLEHKLCKSCGLCCDGSLFVFVNLTDKDKQFTEWHLLKSGKNCELIFKQPCCYFNSRACMIYDQIRPAACSTFVCNIIVDYRVGDISFDQALIIIQDTVKLATNIKSKIVKNVSEYGQPLITLFNNYMSSQKNNNQAVMMEYGVLQHRLLKYFGKNIKYNCLYEQVK